MVMVPYAQLVVSVSLVFYISWLNRDRKKLRVEIGMLRDRLWHAGMDSLNDKDVTFTSKGIEVTESAVAHSHCVDVRANINARACCSRFPDDKSVWCNGCFELSSHQ